MYSINKLNEDVQIRNQFPKKPNLLTNELITATGFDSKKAMKLQQSVCKALTFWLEGFNKNLLNLDFTAYYKKCIDNNWIRKDDAWLNLEFGFVDNVLKTEFADKFNIKVFGINNYDEFISWANKQDHFLGTLRIVSKSGGKHSLETYKQDSKLYISDTSSRGIGTLFSKEINSKNFIYFTMLS